MHKIKQIVTKMAAFVLVLAVLLSSGLFAATEVFAAQSDTNEESGYRYVLDDDAGFIEDNKEILNRMKEITQYVMLLWLQQHLIRIAVQKAMQWLRLNRILAMAQMVWSLSLTVISTKFIWHPRAAREGYYPMQNAGLSVIIPIFMRQRDIIMIMILVAKKH